MNRKFVIVVAGTVAIGMGSALAEDPGVTSDTIRIGQSAAFEGPASALGQGMRKGLQAAFNLINENGGVNGRKIEMVTYDDGYEPDKAIANTRRLIETDKVFALIGEVGTPTSKVAQPIAKQADVPLIGPFTGAGFLRDPSNAHVINFRASYDQETEAWIHHLTKDLGVKRIAILYQDDSFGRVGLSGVNKALKKRDMKLVAQGTYQRNTTAVKSALLSIREGDPEAVVMVGAYKPIAAFIKLAKKFKVGKVFVTISFVGPKALAKELGGQGKNVVVSQVVPFPEDTSIALVRDYHAALKKLDPSAEPGFVSLEGFAVGRLFAMALERVQGELTRKKLLEAIYSTGTFDLGGVRLNFGRGDNQGMDMVFLTIIQSDGTFKSVRDLRGIGG
jgi:ABC-type branched-subunit amino acid transport system substrate-binding protein